MYNDQYPEDIATKCEGTARFWPDSLNILSASIALGRPIYLYHGFRYAGQSLEEFQQSISAGGDDAFSHLAFYPHSSYIQYEPIRIFLSGGHFSAILPSRNCEVEFRPAAREFFDQIDDPTMQDPDLPLFDEDM